MPLYKITCSNLLILIFFLGFTKLNAQEIWQWKNTIPLLIKDGDKIYYKLANERGEIISNEKYLNCDFLIWHIDSFFTKNPCNSNYIYPQTHKINFDLSDRVICDEWFEFEKIDNNKYVGFTTGCELYSREYIKRVYTFDSIEIEYVKLLDRNKFQKINNPSLKRDIPIYNEDQKEYYCGNAIYNVISKQFMILKNDCISHFVEKYLYLTYKTGKIEVRDLTNYDSIINTYKNGEIAKAVNQFLIIKKYKWSNILSDFRFIIKKSP